MLSCAPVLLPFAASRAFWAAGPACGPTQSDEAACQHLGEGGSDPPSWSRLLFQVAHTYLVHDCLFASSVSHRIMSAWEEDMVSR